MVSNGPSSTDRFEVQRNALIQEETEKVDREIGGRFRQWRQDAGLSQQDVSEMLGKVGLPLHQTNIAKMESGKRPIRLAEAVAVCRVFNMDPIVMFLADEDSPAQASDLDRITRMVDKQRKLVRQLGGSLADLESHRMRIALDIVSRGVRETKALNVLRESGLLNAAGDLEPSEFPTMPGAIPIDADELARLIAGHPNLEAELRSALRQTEPQETPSDA